MNTMLLHTLRHLKARQIFGRAQWYWRKRFASPNRFAKRQAPPYPGCRWNPSREFLPAMFVPNDAGSLKSGSLTFLNCSRLVGWPPQWSCPALPKLWQYNLHYFDFIWALDLAAAQCLAVDWIQQHRLAKGQVGWEPYPTSLRMMNWCTYFFGRHCERVEVDRAFCRQLWGSIFLQTEWLSRRVELHLLGNHLLENAAALAIVGSCFAGEAAGRWLAQGRRLLVHELNEQVLADGLHFERSPMYHCRVLHLLLLLNAGIPEIAELVAELVRRACAALLSVCHPDGRIALLNDSAFGICHAPQTLADYSAEALGEPKAEAENGAFALGSAGYFGYRDGNDYVICDAGEIGPSYIPGHAHGDMFSFELSFDGCRVFTDSGVSDYEISETRRYCRSTAAHNTVEVAGQDQCEFWAAFRVGRRGRPRDLKWEAMPQGFRLKGWHDGYMRLPGQPRHERQFSWHRDGVLLVRDRVSSRVVVDVVARFHLHPDCRVAQLAGMSARIEHPGGYCTLTAAGNAALSVEESRYCPEFGKVIPRQCICLRSSGKVSELAVVIVKNGSSSEFCLSRGATVRERQYGW